MSTRSRHCPYEIGDTITGTTYVTPDDRRRGIRPGPFTGRVVQVGSGWDGVDSDAAYLWARLPSAREVQALIQDCVRLPR
ncbi:hypothetical protein [Streptomyces sp. NPDC086023]|uniref:hypothetical protein n=1 Tax=Streptomyces sp. NPDC086023 TaxID=3365746 RepID=UPI0037D1D694